MKTYNSLKALKHENSQQFHSNKNVAWELGRDRGRGRQRRRQNGVAYPYMGTARHFHVVFDVRVLDLNLSNKSTKLPCCFFGNWKISPRIKSKKLHERNPNIYIIITKITLRIPLPF